jgi:hypothetical protein
LNLNQIALRVIQNNQRSDIQESVFPFIRELRTDCSANESGDRPSFEEILDRLKEMTFKSKFKFKLKFKFRVMANANSLKLLMFVKTIEELKERNSIDPHSTKVSI